MARSSVNESSRAAGAKSGVTSEKQTKGIPEKTIGRKVPEGLRAATTSTDPHSSETLGRLRHSSVSSHGGYAYSVSLPLMLLRDA